MEWRGEEKTPGRFKKVLFAFILSLAFIFSSRAENMPNTCVVYGCNSTANLQRGIRVHKIPFWSDTIKAVLL